MQKQSFFLAACIPILLAIPSVGQAQSEFMGNQNFSGNENYSTVVWGEQGMIQPAPMLGTKPPVNSTPVYGMAPAPPVPWGQTQAPAPFFLPAVPVATTYPVHPMSPPVRYVMPTTTIRQPICLSGG